MRGPGDPMHVTSSQGFDSRAPLLTANQAWAPPGGFAKRSFAGGTVLLQGSGSGIVIASFPANSPPTHSTYAMAFGCPPALDAREKEEPPWSFRLAPQRSRS